MRLGLTAHVTCPVRGLRSGHPVRSLCTGPLFSPTAETHTSHAPSVQQPGPPRSERHRPRACDTRLREHREGRPGQGWWGPLTAERAHVPAPDRKGLGRDEHPWEAVTEKTGGRARRSPHRQTRLSETGATVALPDRRTPRGPSPSRGQRAPARSAEAQDHEDQRAGHRRCAWTSDVRSVTCRARHGRVGTMAPEVGTGVDSHAA